MMIDESCFLAFAAESLGGEKLIFSGSPSVRRWSSVDTYSASRDISVFSVRISAKLGINDHHVSWPLLIRFSRSEVKGRGHNEIKCLCCFVLLILLFYPLCQVQVNKRDCVTKKTIFYFHV